MLKKKMVDVLGSITADEEEEIDMKAVEVCDGQQYVVLEVIQLADGEVRRTTMVLGTDGADDDDTAYDFRMENWMTIPALQSATRKSDKSKLDDETGYDKY